MAARPLRQQPGLHGPGRLCKGGSAAGRAGWDLHHAAGRARLCRRCPAGELVRKDPCAGLPDAAAAGVPRGRTRRYAVRFLRQLVPGTAGAALCGGIVQRPARHRRDPDDGRRRLGAVRRRCRPAGGQNGRKICAPGDALTRRRRRTGKQRGCSGEPGQRLRQSDAEQAVRLFCHRKAGLAPGRERE